MSENLVKFPTYIQSNPQIAHVVQPTVKKLKICSMTIDAKYRKVAEKLKPGNI